MNFKYHTVKTRLIRTSGRRLLLLCVQFGVASCSLESKAPPSTGVPAIDGGESDAGLSECSDAWIIAESNYQASNIAVLDRSGKILSASVDASKNSNGTPLGALGGDAAFPSDGIRGNELIILDRYPNGVLRFVDLETATVDRSWSPAPDYRSNPHDVWKVDQQESWVTRFEGVIDGSSYQGFDLAAFDSSNGSEISSISFAEAISADEKGKYYPYPSQLLVLGKQLLVSLMMYQRGFAASAESRIAVVDIAAKKLVEVIPLPGLKGCSLMKLSPNKERIAVACTGEFGGDSNAEISSSGVALLDATDLNAPIGRLYHDSLSQPLGFSLGFLDDDRLLAIGMGKLDPSNGSILEPDRLFRFSLNDPSAEPKLLLESKDKAFVLGGISCDCGTCLVTDAERNSAFFVKSEDESVEALSYQGELPPRSSTLWFR